ncbi:MAG: penicillin acylase family protein [Candidatus Hydrogenedentota bacterium]|nr:MAG: penicillin acylase family protein [Candidatus Hydrogenedentota bacterium]
MKVRLARLVASYLLSGLTLWAVLCGQAEATGIKLSGKTVVDYDRFGVPHITASNDSDLFFAQGFVTARDRLWQMEYNRRLVAGRLAEILGGSMIEQDFEVRRIGLYRSAAATYETLSEEMKKLTAAYAAGVNYYISTHRDKLPREFKNLGYVPEPWHPIDTLAIPMEMMWHLSGSLEEELMLAKLVDELGPAKALELISDEPADPETHMKWKQASGVIPEGFGPNGFKILSGLANFSACRGATRFIGSNNWVIDGEKSATGAPILANDPHLALVNPPIWYELHLMGPGINVIGSTFPGVPGVIVGHNEHIAWGVTNVGYDVCDLYVEKLDPERRDHYIHKGESLPFKRVTEKIKYKSGDSMKDIERDILFTVHGPVVEEQEQDGEVISMRWTGHEPSTEFRFMYLLNRASNVEEFRTALSYYRLGAQNFIYADIGGNIFYQPTGKVPIRKGAPYLPLDGSSGEYEWEGYIPYDELPRVLNPEEHFIATANARPVDASYPYYIGYFFDIGYRVRRIKDLLRAEEKLTFEDVRAIQADNYVLAAERLKPRLLAAVEREKSMLPERTRKAAKMVKEWDNHSTMESAACTIFNKWLERIALNTLKDDLSEDSFEYWASNPDVIVVLLLRSASPNALQFDWFDNTRTTMHETGHQIIARSLQETVDELGLMYGYDMEGWKWGKIHTTTLRHELGKRNPLYNNGPYPRAGSNDTVDNAGFSFFEHGFESRSGPSLRMTVELKPGVERAANTIPGGQSGDPSNEHYQDQLLDFWLKHEAHPMLFTRKKIKENLEHTITLVPAE